MKPKLLSIAELSKLYPMCSESAWRMRLSIDYHGVKKCIRKIGYRTYIDIKAFEKWLKEQTKEK
jgi:hypothetical protein